jgi:hypothetical protein
MGSPQYGRLILDGKAISPPVSVEARSLLWSDDGTRLAAQELVGVAGRAHDTGRRLRHGASDRDRFVTSAKWHRKSAQVRARRLGLPPLASRSR